MGVRKLDIKNAILTRAKALGNTEYGFKEVCSDLINQYGNDPHAIRKIANGTFLSESTVKRMATLTEAESGLPYRPNSDTVERVLRYFNAEVSFDQVVIKNKYQNKEKPEL